MELSAPQWNICKLTVGSLLLVNSVLGSVSFIMLADNFRIHRQNMSKYYWSILYISQIVNVPILLRNPVLLYGKCDPI